LRSTAQLVNKKQRQPNRTATAMTNARVIESPIYHDDVPVLVSYAPLQL
jgi:hypothetical protein